MSELIEGQRPKRGRPSLAVLAARKAEREARKAARAPEVTTDPVRAEVRAETPRAPDPRSQYVSTDPATEAARYARLYEEHMESGDEGVDKYKLDVSIIPDGWDYNWKTVEVLNQPQPAYAATLTRAGWRPVLTGRHPELMPPGHPADAPIKLDGLGLFERPLEMSARQRIKEAKAARDAVRAKEMQAGNTPNNSLDRINPTIKKEYGYVPIPKTSASA